MHSAEQPSSRTADRSSVFLRLLECLRSDAAVLAVAAPTLATMVVAAVLARIADEVPFVYTRFEWSVFGDALPVFALLLAALCFRSRWCAALAAVLACFGLLQRIFTLVLYRETSMTTDFSDLKLLWTHTDPFAISAVLGRFCWLWLFPAVLAVLAAVAALGALAGRGIRELGPKRARVWKWMTAAMLVAAAAANVWYLIAEPKEEFYTGHLVRPLPVAAAYFIRDAARSGRRESPAGETAPDEASRRLLEELDVIPPAGGSAEPPVPTRFDRIVIVALESLDLAFIRAVNPEMPEDVTPNLDRLLAGYPSLRNYFCASQPTSWGLTGMLLSKFDFLRESERGEKPPSLFGVVAELGYHTMYFSPIVGTFGDNRRIYGETFAPEKQYFLEDWERDFGMRRRFRWGLSDRDLYSCVLKVLRGSGKRRFVVLISTMDTHPPYTADGITPEDEKRFPTPFLRALHQADRHLGDFLREFMADPTLYDDRTLIVVTADHTATHGENYLKRKAFYPERVPLVFITPAKEAFRELDRNKYASGIDLAPTLIKLAGGKVPAAFMGRDLFSRKNLALSWVINGTLFVRTPERDVKIPAGGKTDDPVLRALVEFCRVRR